MNIKKMTGRAYRLPTRLRCEVCQREIHHRNTFFYIIKDQPYTFCDPPKRMCFNEWWKVQMSPDILRPKGLL